MAEFIVGQQSSGGQPGDIIVSAASSRIGCLLCDGSAYSRTTYSSLFAAIGVAYGIGDGSTTFNVPDFRGRTVIGANTSGSANNVGVVAKDQNNNNLATRSLGQASGEENHTLAARESGVNDLGGTKTGNAVISDPGHSHGGSTQAPGYSFVQTDTGIALVGVSTTGGTNVISTNGPLGYNLNTGPASTGIGDSGHTHGLNARTADLAHNNMQPYGVCNVFIHT